MKPVQPYPQVYERLDEWPIYKLSQDRRRFIEEVDEFTLNRLAEEHPKLYNLISETIYLERIRVKETPWKVDPPNEGQFWNRLRSKLFKTENESPKQAKETQKEVIQRIIHRYSTEIVGTFSIPTCSLCLAQIVVERGRSKPRVLGLSCYGRFVVEGLCGIQVQERGVDATAYFILAVAAANC